MLAFSKKYLKITERYNLMNVHLLRKRLTTILDNKGISFVEVERGAGLPRSTFRNFMSGVVKEPRLEIILSAAKFLDIDPATLFAEGEMTEKNPITFFPNETLPNSLNKNLTLECVNLILNILTQKNISPSFDIFINVLNKVYNYTSDYSNGVLDKSFVEWCINAEFQRINSLQSRKPQQGFNCLLS